MGSEMCIRDSQVQIGLTNAGIEPMHPLANHFHVKQSAEGEFEVKTDAGNGVIDFDRLMRKLKSDDYDGVVTGEFVAAPDVIEAGWDMKVETGKMKKVIEDALEAVRQGIDQAVVHRLSQFKIIHGHGSGRLRTAVRDLLAQHPHVESFRFAEPWEGGMGGTVARLKTSITE